MARVEASKSNKKENQRVIDAAQLRTRKDNQSPSVMSKNCPKKLRHDRESNPGHLRDRQVYSPLYYRDLMVEIEVNFKYWLLFL